jgi:hypothetical protein
MSIIDRMLGKEKHKETTGLEEIHKEAIKRFEIVENAERDQRQQAIEDALFAHSTDGQWEDDIVEKRKDRPRYTIDRVSPALDQVNGDQRQNRTQIKIRPRTGGEKDIAKIRMGLTRSIEAQSDATSIYDMAFDEVITSGYGGWRVLTEFSDDDVFTQEIKIAPIKSAASSLWLDTSATKHDKRDAMWGFLVEDIDIEVFNDRYPDAVINDFSVDTYTKGACSLWFKDNTVKIAEYWRVELVDREIALLSDGRVIDLKEEEQVLDELAAKDVIIVQKRKTKLRKVESYIMNGAEILEGPMEWAGKYIPLVPVYGRTYNIEGKEYVRGIVRKAKDPARMYNYTTTTALEATALTPKDPIWITAQQAKGYENELKSFNNNNSPFMVYNPDPLAPGAPQRTGAPSVQQALIQQQSQAAMDIYATTGIQPPSLGLNPEMQSGKAIIAQQKMGDRSTFVFSDNLYKSIKFTGDIIDDLTPRIYDTQQVVTVLNFDGTTEDVEINTAALDKFNQPITDEQTGEQVIVNNISAGKYETYVEAGPAYNTLREESSQQLIELANGNPEVGSMIMDVIIKGLNIIDSEEVVKRVRKKLIGQGFAAPTEEETKEMGLDQPQQPSEEEIALLDNIKMQTAQMMADIENKNADTDNKDAKTLQTKLQAQKVAVDAYNTLIEAYEKQVMSGIPFGIEEHQIRTAQAAILSLSQDELVKDAVNNPNGLV